MDIVLKREAYLKEWDEERFGLVLEQQLLFVPFYHKFVDKYEKIRYGSNENELMYFFTELPKLKRSVVSDDLNSLGALPEDVVLFLIYYHDGKTHFLCSIIENDLEIGSKHATMASNIPHPTKSVFVSAGEMRQLDYGQWEFNFFSGTFIVPRLEITFEDSTFKPEEIADLKASIRDYQFVASLLKQHHPYFEFNFAQREFPKRKFPLDTICNVVVNDHLPYIYPYTPKYSMKIRNWLMVLSAFRVLTRNKVINESITVQVNAEAVEVATTIVDTTAKWSMKHVDANIQVEEPSARLKGMPVMRQINMFPSRDELKHVMNEIRSLGVKRLEYDRTYNFGIPLSENADTFGIVGKTFQVRLGKEKMTIHIEKLLGESNSSVYLVRESGKKLCLKVDSYYPQLFRIMHKKQGFAYQSTTNIEILREFYEQKYLWTFKIPSRLAVGYLIPYLGVPLDKVELSVRKPLYNKFVMQYLTKFRSMLHYTRQRVLRSHYNDIKPENCTMDDDQNFHLIDLDQNSYTPSFYGDTRVFNLPNQLFGIAVLCYWFMTDERPFTGNETFAEKGKWALAVSEQWRPIFSYIETLGTSYPTLEELVDVFVIQTRKRMLQQS